MIFYFGFFVQKFCTKMDVSGWPLKLDRLTFQISKKLKKIKELKAN